MPVQQVPLIGAPLAAALDPFFRVVVETGYNRTINPGQPTQAQWLYFPNPIQTVVKLIAAIPTGLDNLISVLSGNPDNRPFGTPKPGPYGVGGPPVNTGCGTPPCGTPTPYLAADTTPQLAEAKLAEPTQVAPDPKPNNGTPTTLRLRTCA